MKSVIKSISVIRILILFISIIAIIGAILIPVFCWQKEGFDLNFYAEVFGVIIGALFTYFIVDYVNEDRLISKWKFYEVEIKTDLYYYFVQSVAGIFLGHTYKSLLYKNDKQDLINEAFDNTLSVNPNDFIPKAKRLLNKLNDYYKSPDNIQINTEAATIYNKERSESFEKLSEKLFSLLYLMPWLRETYKDFTNLKTHINHLTTSSEIYNNHLLKNSNNNALIKVKKQYIFELLCFIKGLIEFNETQNLGQFLTEKANNQRKSAKNAHKWYQKTFQLKNCQ